MAQQQQPLDETLSKEPADVSAPLTRAEPVAGTGPNLPGQENSATDPPLTRLTASEPAVVPALSAASLPSIPGYEIRSELGRGGMGVVYHAVQTRLNRHVALKMILAGAHAGPTHRARFQIEAETLASLQHPNIVRLYEIGEHAGCPYLAMEYLDGEALDHRLGRERLPYEVSAHLIEILARAVHCAHLRGIVHRDLKPGNVILSRESAVTRVGQTLVEGHSTTSATNTTAAALRHSALGVPKLLDFGLAKRLEGATCTRDGSVIGTPNYMAPEQAEGRVSAIGPATDVWALGAILYECLTGRAPFVGDTVVRTLTLVQHEEPPPPSRLGSRLPRDLEVICLKCLQKDPKKRYATAEALAEDLRAYLAREPIKARPVGMGERAWKWARRRPAVAALVAVCVLAAIGFVGGGVWYNGQLRVANVQLKAARDRAEQRSRLVRTAVDEMYTQVAEKWLGDEPHMDALQEEFLNKARRLYEELARDEGDDPTLQAETAEAYFRIGEIYRKLNKFADAETAYTTAITAQERLASRPQVAPQALRSLANSYTGIGELRRVTDHPHEAAAAYARALKLQRELARAHPDEPELVKDEARSHYNLGLARMELNQPAAARAEMESAIGLLEPLAKADRKDRSYRQELARVRLNLGVVLKAQKDGAGAAAAYEAAIRLQRQLIEDDPKRPDYQYELAVTLNNLGNLYQEQGQAEAARPKHEEARALLERLQANFSARPLYQKELANTCNSLAAVVWRTDPRRAAALWEESEHEFGQLAATWKNVHRYRQGQGQAMGNRGWLLMEKLDDPHGARVLLTNAVQILEDICASNPENQSFRDSLNGQYLNLAACLLRLENYDQAEQVLRKLLTEKSPASEQQRFAAARLLAECGTRGNRSADALWAVNVLRDLDPAKLGDEQRALTDTAFTALRSRPDVQELLRRWQAPQGK